MSGGDDSAERCEATMEVRSCVMLPLSACRVQITVHSIGCSDTADDCSIEVRKMGKTAEPIINT